MSREIIKTVEMGALIRKRRNELCWSQGYLAEQLGISFQHVQRYESGETMLNVENVQRIAGVLGLPITDFFVSNSPLMVAEPVESYFTKDEKALLRNYRSIRVVADKKMALNIVKRLAKK